MLKRCLVAGLLSGAVFSTSQAGPTDHAAGSRTARSHDASTAVHPNGTEAAHRHNSITVTPTAAFAGPASGEPVDTVPVLTCIERVAAGSPRSRIVTAGDTVWVASGDLLCDDAVLFDITTVTEEMQQPGDGPCGTDYSWTEKRVTIGLSTAVRACIGHYWKNFNALGHTGRQRIVRLLERFFRNDPTFADRIAEYLEAMAVYEACEREEQELMEETEEWGDGCPECVPPYELRGAEDVYRTLERFFADSGDLCAVLGACLDHNGEFVIHND